jgi:hypothetical protein
LASTTTMSRGNVRGALTFTAAGSGTHMQWIWEVPPTGLARMLSPIVGAIGRRSEQACWEGLKRFLETNEVRA